MDRSGLIEQSPHSDSDPTDFYASPPSADQDDPTTISSEQAPAVKRKLDEIEDQPIDKRQKAQSLVDRPEGTPPQTSSLPAEIWQHIFSFVSPTTFLSLLQVCRNFRTYLTDSKLASGTNQDYRGRLNLVDPDLIWRAARTRWHPEMPTIPPGCNEVILFRILWFQNCQYCGRKPTHGKKQIPWEMGPGEDNVCRIWPFLIRSCGQCLIQRIQTVNSLMFSSDFSALLPAAAFAFLTQHSHVVPSFVLRSDQDIPANVQVRKFYFIPQLTSLKNTLQNAREKELDAATLFQKLTHERENVDGLIGQWEAWEANTLAVSRSSDNSVTRLTCEGGRGTGSSKSVTGTDSRQQSPFYNTTRSTEARVDRIQLQRRQEIERRCAALSRPITPNMLEKLEPFKASILIARPLTDSDWDLLKSKLQTEVDSVQRRIGADFATHVTSNTATTDQPGSDAANSIKRRWEALQAPIRDALSRYVDDLIRTTWVEGREINAHTAPRFAADALVYARARYAAENPKKMQAGSAFQLGLHNMKWLFEQKIKPLTETAHGTRELFRCAECGHESRTFAFEGLIQHYKAKHTKDFGEYEVGGVAWYESLWPEKPPFQCIFGPASPRNRLPTPLQLGQVSTQSNQANSQYNNRPAHTLYQPVPGPYGVPPTSPGFYQNVHGSLGGYYTPTPQYPSVATSPAFSQTSGYNPPGRHPYLGPATPFDGQGSQLGQHPQTPVSSGPWSFSPGYVGTQVPYAPSPAQNQPSFLHVQMDEVASITREIWSALDRIKLIPPSVRIYVTIQHIVSRFRKRFSNDPNLDLFFQCVESHPCMTFMRDANGLACRVCVLENESREEGHSHAFPLTGGERKLYNFYFLLMHFKNVHVETRLARENAESQDDPQGLTRLDWKEDMIELPDDALIANLEDKPGMNSQALQILKEVFPHLIGDEVQKSLSYPQNQPTSHVGTMGAFRQDMSVVEQQSGVDITGLSDAMKTEPIKKESEYPFPNLSSYPETSNHRPDEYDPHRPSFQGPSPFGSHGYASNNLSRGLRYGLSPFHSQGYNATPEAPTNIVDRSSDLLQSLATPQIPQSQLNSYPIAQGPPSSHHQRMDHFPPPPPPHAGSPTGTRGGFHTYSHPPGRPPQSHPPSGANPAEYAYTRHEYLHKYPR